MLLMCGDDNGICNGKMVAMNAITEIDKAGRIVVPKKLREALHLVPGTRVSIRREGDRVVIEPECAPRGLYMKRGTLVYDAGSALPSDAVEWVAEDREMRMKHLAGDELE
jgi:AbrB family looped-hinge helix DNA binding protein